MQEILNISNAAKLELQRASRDHSVAMEAALVQLHEAGQANARMSEQLGAEQQALREALAANKTLEDSLAASKTDAAQVSCLSGVLPCSVKTLTFPVHTFAAKACTMGVFAVNSPTSGWIEKHTFSGLA